MYVAYILIIYMSHTARGFTLIELLVVIAIIGILAGIVLASLNSARGGAGDAKVKAQLGSMRSQSELYTGATTAVANAACPTSASATLFGSANNGLGALLGGITLANTRCSYAGTTLPSNGGAWAVAALISNNTSAWCVDSTGVSRGSTSGGVAYTTIASTGTGNTCL